MPVGWGWRLTAPANSSGTKGQIWWQPHTSHLANCAQLSQELRLVSRGDCASMPSDCLREPRWGGQKFPAARFVQSRHSPLREERRGLWLKVWCLRCWLPFLPLPRFCSRQVARNPRGCSGANATQLPLPTTSVCTGAGWTNAVQAARPFGVTESPCACPRPWKGLSPVFTPFDF